MHLLFFYTNEEMAKLVDAEKDLILGIIMGVRVPLSLQTLLNKKNMKQKMLTLKDFDKVLVSYLYSPDTYKAVLVTKIDELTGKKTVTAEVKTIKGEKRGIVVAVNKNSFGWALCTKSRTWQNGYQNDIFDKNKGLGIALSRADKASCLDAEECFEFYNKVPFSLLDIFNKMKERAEIYFKDEE